MAKATDFPVGSTVRVISDFWAACGKTFVVEAPDPWYREPDDSPEFVYVHDEDAGLPVNQFPYFPDEIELVSE